MLLLAEPAATPLDTLYEMNSSGPPSGANAMSQDSSMPPSGGYTNEAWANLSPYNQSPYGNSPMTDYGFPNYVHHGLPSESLTRMPPPPHQPQPQPQQPPQYHHPMIQPAPSPHLPQQPQPPHGHMGHHQLPMLNTNPTWPSQLTNPSPNTGSYSAPPPTITPVSSATTADPPLPPIREEKQRRSLSVEQKRQMCQYHEENPGIKQAEIGAKFGVERSTVSKVLGKKDEYLQRDTETDPSGTKRAKSKNHSLERTLVNFVKRQQASGKEIKDEELMEKARHFARISPDDKEGLLKTLTPNWLRKFKRDNKIGSGGRLMRRASETNIPDSARMSMVRAAAAKGRSSRITSPASAGGQMSPLSESRSDEDMKTDNVDFDFSYRQPASQSTTSLTSDVRDPGPPPFSAATMSPVAPFTFSPDPNTGAFQVDQSMHMHPEQLDYHHREKRSNTFPSLNIDYMNHANKTDAATPRLPPSALTAPPSAIESPVHKELKPLLPANNIGVGMEPNFAGSPTIRRQGSNPSLSGRANVASGSSSAVQSVDSSPISPSQEDARRAANTLLNYMSNIGTQQGAFEHNELMMVMQLTKKLQLHQMSVPSMGSRPRGGLSRIPEGDGEAAASAEVVMETT